MRHLPKAVLWDMDGTLVDTEPEWMAAEREFVEAFGGTWSDDHAMNLIGNPLLVSAEYIRTHGGVPMEPDEIVTALLDRMIARLKENVRWQIGARELLADLLRHNVPNALVTSSYRRMTEVVISALPPGTFGSTVSGDEVEQGKPHPEPYLRAAAELGVAPADCVVIEDSATGAASGLAAGARVVLVPNIATPDVARHVPGAVMLDSLAGVDARRLARAVSGLR
ncbi:MAG TPA: HAD family phosphatase [Jiangellaceae bacterium]